MNPEVSISLVAYNQLSDLKNLLPTLIPAAEYVNAEILLVDNYRLDGIRGYVENAYPVVQLIENANRAGYGENHNLNLARARGDYFVIMNTDMQVPEVTFFDRLKRYLDDNPDVGIVAPKVLNMDGTLQYLNKRDPTILDLALRWLNVSWAKKRLGYYMMQDVGYDHGCDVPFISGSFMFTRTALLRELGGFDTRYFMYFEDADLSRRVRQFHRTRYYPAAEIKHEWHRSHRKSFKHTMYFMKSAIKYFNRWGYRFWL